ncbi:hypothetical protein D3C76_745170 [compost metagenome]
MVEVNRVLHEHRIAAQYVGLGTVGGADRSAWHFAAVHRVEVAEGGQALLPDQVGAVDLAVFVIDPQHQVMLHAADIDLAFEAGGGETVGADSILRAVHAARQRAVAGVDGGHAYLAGVIGFAIPAVAEMGFPVVVEVVVGLEAIQVGAPFHVVERFVEPTLPGDVQRMVVPRIDHRATVERGEELPVFIGEQQLGAFTEPGQRRRHQAFAMHTVVTPVIFVFVVQHHTVGEPGIAQGARAVKGTAAAVLAFAIGRATQGQGVVRIKLGLLADHVHHPARVLNAVEQRGRPLEHFDPVDRRVHASPLYHRHAVAHDRAVAVIAETAGHHRILGAAQRVALGDAADVRQRVIQIARRLVANDLGRDDVDRLGNFLERRRGAHHRADGRRLVTGGLIHLRGDGGGAQVQRALGRQGLQGHGVAIDAAEGQARTAEQALQGLFGTQLAVDCRSIEGIGRFIGVDHADAGDVTEVAQGLGQWFGDHRKAEQRTLPGAGLRSHRPIQRQQRREAQRRDTQPLFDRTRYCPGLHDS